MSELQDCVLVVDDEFLIADMFRIQIESMGIKVCGKAATAAAAIALAQEHRPKVVLMDMRLKGELDGVDASLVIHETVGSKIIFVTGSQEADALARINTDHPYAILHKPLFGQKLQTAVKEAMGF
jgi:CheY-like chemotaxis protein